jgi:hypothetical protein
MTDFTTALPARAPLDPLKHVNFAVGMVLGKDDLDQEFAYLSGHDRWLARDALGYGTLSGLRMAIAAAADGTTEVRIDPGTALTPSGHLVRVATAQCARLDGWLAQEPQRAQATAARSSSPPGVVAAHVVLCYAECPGDEVLIPGEPCRSEDDLRAPSRIADDVRLELRLTPPAQPEEEAVRRFVGALRRAVVVVEDETPSGTLAEFLALVRRLETPLGSPPDVAPMDLSPPASPPTDRRFRIAAREACAWLNAALRVWITEIRPRYRAEFLDGAGCGEGTPSVGPEACLLLGTLLIPTNAEGRAVSAGIVVEESKRPLLGTMRFWQEWQLCGPTNRGERGLQGPQGLGINAVTVRGVAPGGAPTAALDATTRILALGIPAGAPGRDGSPGAGIASVNATTLAAGSAPTAALDATTRVLALGIPAGAPGRDGSPGAGIASVTVTGLAPGGPPTAALDATTRVLTLGIPAGTPGRDGSPGTGIASVTATALPATSAPTAALNATTRVLALGIPAGAPGAGIASVTVSGLAPSGAPTAALDATTRVLALGIPAGAPGRDGSPGAGIASVTVTGLAPGGAPTAALDATTRVLTLGIPAGTPGRDGSPGTGIASVTATALPATSAPTAALNATTRVLALGIPAGAPGGSTAAGAVDSPRDGSETGPIVPARILAAGLVGLSVDPRLRACNGLRITRAAAGRVFLTWSTAASDIAEHLAGKSVIVPKVLPLPLSMQEVGRSTMVVANFIRFNIDPQFGAEMELAVITIVGNLPADSALKDAQFMVELTRFRPRA